MGKTKINVILLGIGVAYVFIFIWQLISPELLSIDLYHTVAWVSLLLSFTELAKSVTHRYIGFLTNKKQKLQHFIDILNMYKKNSATKTLCESLMLEVQPEMSKIEGQLKKRKISDTLSRVIIFVGYILAMSALIILPFIGMSEGIQGQMMISVLTLMTFVILFASIIVDDFFANLLTDFVDNLDHHVDTVISKLEAVERDSNFHAEEHETVHDQ
ncbi:MAG: hypothetical protein FWC66_01595 [Oscillospiraceae bacterium]|nr:hypothetical protein [Oscillospiraceae bacterium]